MTVLQEYSFTLEEIYVPGYEKIYKVTDPASHLQAIICIHNTILGPALGGTRIYPYSSFDDALNDVLRLSKGMTYKSALAETGYGGGKSVIIADPKKNLTKEMLLAFGQAVNSLNGQYICAEDIGCSPKEIALISTVTPYVVGLIQEKSSGNPSPFTAWGTLRGVQSVLKKLYGDDSIVSRTIAIQGLGSVGMVLAENLFWLGAKLIVSDIDQKRAQEFAKKYSATYCSPEEILQVKCDILAPCAMGGILSEKTIPHLRCSGIAGCANNQLLEDSDGVELVKRGILYAPDFVINAGGLMNVAQELVEEGYNPIPVRDKVHKIYDQLLVVYDIAEQNHTSTDAAAKALADYRLKYGIGKRVAPIYFHHAHAKLK